MTDNAVSHHGVAIIGAGFGGLRIAIALKRSLNYDDLIIFERESEVGGTWRANTYPGAASDYPIHGYSFSTDLRYDWPQSHGLQKDILEYIKELTNKYNLYPQIKFNTSVLKAEWEDSSQHWRIVTMQSETGKIVTRTATVLISAIGILEQPSMAGIHGVNCFKGPIFHSAQYRHDISLRNNRVAVIGNGCSATQIVPIITNDPTIDVTSFARTPMWYRDGQHTPYTPIWRWIYSHVPMAALLHRWRIQAQFDSNFFFFRGSGDHWFSRRQRQELVKYIRTHAPEEYHKQLIPTFTPGCRRLIRDKDYLSSLYRPNNRLVFDGVERITENGLITDTGIHHLFDVIILATGFITDNFLVEIRGKGDVTVSDYLQMHGGPQSYLGSTLPGFPNFFLIQGPNTTTGHASVLFTEECQFNYAVQLFRPVLYKELDSVDVTEAATEHFNKWIERRINASIFVNCASWYRVGQRGKVSAIWPGPVALFWWKLLRVRWGDYLTQGKHKKLWVFWRHLANFARLIGAALFISAVGAMVGLGKDLRRQTIGVPKARVLSPAITGLPTVLSNGRV